MQKHRLGFLDAQVIDVGDQSLAGILLKQFHKVVFPYVISKDGKPGPVCTKLYNKLRAIQYGDEPDTHGWVTIVE